MSEGQFFVDVLQSLSILLLGWVVGYMVWRHYR